MLRIMIKIWTCFVLMIMTAIANAQSCPDNNHPHVIDLGLSSGTKWACCNIDAKAPHDIGGFYAWGETEEKDVFSPKNYDNSIGAFFSRVIHLDDSHDVASVKWGDAWHMPSLEQLNELIGNCSYKWETVKGMTGMMFVGKNGNSLFLPAGGKKIDFSWNSKGTYGFYWSDTEYDKSTAHYLYFYEGKIGSFKGTMPIGCLVRPVLKY